MNKEPKPIVIDNFESGISAGPFVDGFSDMRNIDMKTRPGSARLNFQLQATTFTTYYGGAIVTGTATLTNGSTTVPVTSDFIKTGRRVVVSAQSGGAVVNGNTYYVIYVNSTTIKLATSLANALSGSAISYSASGSCTLTTVDLGRPKYMVYDPLSLTYYMQDSNGRIWYSGSGDVNTWDLLTGNVIDANSNGNGLILFNNYIIAFSDYGMEAYGPLNGSPSWKTWAGPSAVRYPILGTNFLDHVPYYNPINGLVYWGEYKISLYGGTYPDGSSGLGSLTQTSAKTFDPTDSTTFTILTNYSGGGFALQIPSYTQVTSLMILGSNLMVGTNQNLIYPWNTTSATYDLPVVLQEANVTSMRTVGNQLYIAVGQRGNIYLFNGYLAKKIAQVSSYLTNQPFNNVTLGNMVIHNSRIYFTVSCAGCSGLYSLDPDSNAVVLENVISSGSYGSIGAITMGLLYSVNNEQIFVGWLDSNTSTTGLDIQKVNGSNFYYDTNYTGYIETQFYNVGLPNAPRGLENFDITLGAKLSAGQGIKIYSRGDTASAYSATPDATFDYTTYGAVDSIKLPFGKDFVNVQFRIYMTTASNSQTTPQLNSIIIK